MWTLVIIVVVFFLVRFWDPGDANPAPPPLETPRARATAAMAASPPPLVDKSITYRLTRWDLLIFQLTVILRNRITRLLFPVGLILIEFIVLIPGLSLRPLATTVSIGIFWALRLTLAVILGVSIVSALLTLLLSNKGMVGRHVLEITKEGLRERTEINDTTHDWGSVRRIVSLWGYLYIYIGEMKSYQVPRRGISPPDFAAFETALRAHAAQANGFVS